MQQHSLIWIHEKALGQAHPVFSKQSKDVKAIHIWDNKYYNQRGYTLKRLVFIYETLCELPVDIIYGDTIEILRSMHATNIMIPYTPDTVIKKMCDDIARITPIEIIKEHPLVSYPPNSTTKRFFKYWNTVKQQVFLINGEEHAKRS